jgi:Lysozyme like domain
MPVLTWEQVAAVALRGGWPPGAAVVATAITEPESGRDSTIVQAGQPYATTGWGLWQITPGDSVPQFGINRAMLDPLNNAKAGHFKWRDAGGFGPWTTFVDGAYAEWLPDAEEAVRHVTGLSKHQLDQLVAQARKGGGGPATPPPGFHPDWSGRVRQAHYHVHVAARHFTGYGQGISGLQPRFTPPAVVIPDPQQVLLPNPGGKRA